MKGSSLLNTILLLSSVIMSAQVFPLSSCAEENVLVDYAVQKGAASQRATGFLHAISPTAPEDQWIVPLKLKTLRTHPFRIGGTGGAFANHDRLTALGVRIQLVMSDAHRYGVHGWPGDDGDWERWERIVTDLVTCASEEGSTFVWDIWDEPDSPHFWNPTPGDATASLHRFHETWSRAYRLIRAKDPKAVIVGPSNSAFKGNLFSVADFLTFAHENSVLPDIVSWHEWTPDRIVAHIDEVRRYMAEHGIPNRPISINEYVSHVHQTRPGILVRYFAALEEAEVESAVHACWPDPNGQSLCYTTYLNGILTLTYEPRSTWWAYRAYADLEGSLLSVEGGKTVAGLASFESKNMESVIVLGREGDSLDEVVLNLINLDRENSPLSEGGGIHVTAKRIADSGWDALAEPVTTFEGPVDVTDGTGTVRLTEFGATDGYWLEIVGAGP